MKQPTEGLQRAGSTSHIGAIGRQISPKAPGPGSADCKLGSQAPIRGPAPRIRRSLAIRDRLRKRRWDSKGRWKTYNSGLVLIQKFSRGREPAKVKRLLNPHTSRARIGPIPKTSGEDSRDDSRAGQRTGAAGGGRSDQGDDHPDVREGRHRGVKAPAGAD